jgi:hypothetical protein
MITIFDIFQLVALLGGVMAGYRVGHASAGTVGAIAGVVAGVAVGLDSWPLAAGSSVSLAAPIPKARECPGTSMAFGPRVLYLALNHCLNSLVAVNRSNRSESL